MMQASMNFVSYSLKRRLFPMWYLRSPPVSKSLIRYRFSLSWKAKLMFTRKGCYSLQRSFFSLMTEVTDLFAMIRALDISFMAYTCMFFLYSTRQT